jgi:hypothetical protein
LGFGLPKNGLPYPCFTKESSTLQFHALENGHHEWSLFVVGFGFEDLVQGLN